MEYSRFTLFVIFANIIFLGDSSNLLHKNFLECLTDQFLRSNSTTDLIYTPQNPKYTSLLRSANLRTLSASREKPNLILTPYHESEIVAAVYCSKELGIQIRVRSGGHDYEGLSYASETPFVVVDLRNLSSISIDSDKKTAWVQSGATLGELYYALGKKNKTLAFPAGVCPTIGVGGHLSGGGWGMISRKHALASDHIIDAKLINAEGKILDRRSMGEDLFWAIRGGGGTSFGIVVAFKVSLVTVPETVTVFSVNRAGEAAKQVVNRWQHIADKLDDNLVIRLFLNPAQSGNRTVVVSFTGLYLGSVHDLLLLIKKQFPELGLVKQDCTETSWVESALFFAGIQNKSLDALLNRTPMAAIYFKGKSDYVSSPIPLNGLNEIWRLISEENFKLQFSPYGGVLNTISESETPFPHRKSNIFSIHYAFTWSNPKEAQKNLETIRRAYSSMAPYVAKSPRAAYLNYRDLDIGRNNIRGNTSYAEASVWGHKYFKNNFKRLVQIKTKVDPSNFFRNEQSIPPLSSK